MTDLRTEAMKMALEALEVGDSAQRAEAVIALSDALAQPEQEPVGTYQEVMDTMLSLARGTLEQQQIYTHMKDKLLYTAPPIQQEMLKQAYLDGVNSGIKAMQARSEKLKLKEKNVR